MSLTYYKSFLICLYFKTFKYKLCIAGKEFVHRLIRILILPMKLDDKSY